MLASGIMSKTNDLTRSLILTILALILQVSFAWWLNAKNGWQIVNLFLEGR